MDPLKILIEELSQPFYSGLTDEQCFKVLNQTTIDASFRVVDVHEPEPNFIPSDMVAEIKDTQKDG